MTDLPPRQRRALDALASGATYEAAAAAAGVRPRALHRWRQSDAFQAEYRRITRAAADEGVAAVQRAAQAAARALLDVIETGPPAARVSAARAVLDVVERAREHDIEDRIAQLEQEVARWRDAI